MQKRQQIVAIVLVLLAMVTAYGIWMTRPGSPRLAATGENKSTAEGQSPVDQSPLTTAQRLVQLAATHDERMLAQEALRLADFDVDMAFDNALRQARLHPPPLSAEAKEFQARVQKAEKFVRADQDRAKQLSEQAVKVPETKKDTVEADLIQAQADMELDQDELDDAKQDLIRAGGNVTDRIQALKKEHEDASHSTSNAIPTGPEPVEQVGLIHRIIRWRELHEKQMQLWQAKGETETALALLSAKHNALDAQVDQQKAAIPELSHHSKSTKTELTGTHVSAAEKSQEDTATLLMKTEELADNQKVLATYDKRIETKKELAAVYGQWIALVAAQQRKVLHRALMGCAIILGIGLLGLYFSTLLDSLVKKLSMDRRQVESLRTAARVSLQIVALCLVLLVVFGPPGQLGTFLGLAGAGLTVALKDFIVGFLGWFVLMGKNGIGLGDWVEINGVTGEVVDIGPFHTVLLETGNWTDSGHPTGRRVTFTNSFAIDGHYFNFSTTGQWLWDELQIVLPTGEDPYPMIDAIQKRVLEATQQSSKEAAQEWKTAAGSRDIGSFSSEPAINLKPVLGGVELSVRYITQANQRYQLRTKLNQAAVELLGRRGIAVAAASPPPATSR